MPDRLATLCSRTMNRRSMLRAAGAGVLSLATNPLWAESPRRPYRLHYMLGSALYGTAKLSDVLAEVSRAGAGSIDLWPRPHGNQREQVNEMGPDKFAALLKQYDVKLGAIACYHLGPQGLAPEMQLVRRIGARNVVLVTDARGKGNLRGEELKSAVRDFVAQVKPHAAKAQEFSCTIAIENHANTLLDSPEAIRWFAAACAGSPLGLALAPHHLPQDPQLIAGLVRGVGACIRLFYAQQHGLGFTQKLPKQQELLQMPGRGPLDFTPILSALKGVDFQGPTEIFMHPTPRGVPILDSTAAITAEINRSRAYLQKCLDKVNSAD